MHTVHKHVSKHIHSVILIYRPYNIYIQQAYMQNYKNAPILPVLTYCYIINQEYPSIQSYETLKLQNSAKPLLIKFSLILIIILQTTINNKITF